MTTTKDKKLTANLSAMPKVKAKGKRDGETAFSALYVNDWADANTCWTMDPDEFVPVYDDGMYTHTFQSWASAIDHELGALATYNDNLAIFTGYKDSGVDWANDGHGGDGSGAYFITQAENLYDGILELDKNLIDTIGVWGMDVPDYIDTGTITTAISSIANFVGDPSDLTSDFWNTGENETLTIAVNSIANWIGEPIAVGSLQDPETVYASLSNLSELIGTSWVTLSARATAATGYATTYDLHQGGSLIGSINIPKDFLVKSASISTVTAADKAAGGKFENDSNFAVGDKYIDFVINAKDSSATAEHIYLNVKDLVDVYTAQQNATQIQLAINDNNVISATIVAGSIGTTELSNLAVTTAKIADDAVTTAKILSGAVTNAKIADNAINAAKLSADSVTTDKILSGAVTTAKIADNAITTAKIANGAVTADKLAYLSSIILIDQTSDPTSEHYSALWQLKVVEGRLMVEQFVPSA